MMITRWWAHHTLTPTKAAGDDLQTLRRLRNALEPDSFHDILLGVTSGYLATHGQTTTEHLAEAVLPWLDRWAINGHPVTAQDIRSELNRTARTLQALDLAAPDRSLRSGIWHPGPSATTRVPKRSGRWPEPIPHPTAHEPLSRAI